MGMSAKHVSLQGALLRSFVVAIRARELALLATLEFLVFGETPLMAEDPVTAEAREDLEVSFRAAPGQLNEDVGC